MSPATTDFPRVGGDIVNSRYNTVPGLKAEARPFSGPVHRSIVAVDIEGTTKRTSPVKGELRRVLYELLERALKVAGIGPRHLDGPTDRGDGVLVLIRPHDDVPKTVLLGRMIPALTALLAEYNAFATRPELRLRLRAVVHAGEVHEDQHGFYGEDVDVAFRLLDSPTVKKALRDAPASPLMLVVSEEIYSGIVRQGHLDEGSYQQSVPGPGWWATAARPGSHPGPGQRGPSCCCPSTGGPAIARSAGRFRRIRGRPRRFQAIPKVAESPEVPPLAAVYETLERRLAETEEPFDTEAGLARLKEWMPIERTEL